MKTATLDFSCRAVRLTIAWGVLLLVGLAQSSWAQNGTNPLFLFKNYFVTGDYVVGGWVEQGPGPSGFTSGTISIPDVTQANATHVASPSVPVGADVVAAYLYWATVEGNQSALAGQHAFFNGYAITGGVLGNPNAPTSWSSGGCSGSANGSKTMRTYRADVHPYLPLDTNPQSPTFGALQPNGNFTVLLADSGSNGNTQPNALGASLVIIYRVLNPPTPLNAIILYDGAYAPSNAGQTISQTITGFYQPATSNPVAKITHIVANGQANKGQTVYFGGTALPSPYIATYGANAPAFPGVYGTWDNATWTVSGLVNGIDPETTSVLPSTTNSGCVSWGTIIMSTTVQDTDGDGLLDVWETGQGYQDVVREYDPPNPNGQIYDPTSGQWVALPGANPNVKDLFVEVDWLSNLDGSAGPFLHTHLPKLAALDAVGDAFAAQGINVHFDLGKNTYQNDLKHYVISYPLPAPPAGANPPQPGTGGKAISEGIKNAAGQPLLLCSDGAALCPFFGNTPGGLSVQPAIGWKGGFESVQSFTNNPILGNFQPGRQHSYHYAFFGHSLGAPESFWGTVVTPINPGLQVPNILPQLTSISVTSANKNNTTITIQSPQGMIKPGDCPNAAILACSDANNARVTVSGALGQPNLNGTYLFSNPFSVAGPNNTTITTFTITTANVTSGTYKFNNEPQLGVAYLGPSSTSGHSDLGGGDSFISLGLWGADDPLNANGTPNCEPDPSKPLGAVPYCNNQVGTLNVQTGTLLHELGHSLTLTHGGTYYNDPINYPSLPSYELNCKPNFLSVMSYLFQVRGFVDGGFDYSGQTMPPLNETTTPATAIVPPFSLIPGLSESAGIGDALEGGTAAHLTRWYSAPNAIDKQLQAATRTRYATTHCDGSPLLPGELPSVRVDGTLPLPLGDTFSAPLDWNNDLIAPDALFPPPPPAQPAGIDINHNGVVGDAPFSGFNDWTVLTETAALEQMSARADAFGFSGSGIKPPTGGAAAIAGNVDDDGGGVKPPTGGVKPPTGGVKPPTGGAEQNEDTATSTMTPPTGLTCTIAEASDPGCVNTASGYLENAKGIPLTWIPPDFGQIRFYYVWRAVGNFPTTQQVLANLGSFGKTPIITVSGTKNNPVPPSFTADSNVKNGVTYTYFVTDQNKQGAQSGASTPLVVTVKF